MQFTNKGHKIYQETQYGRATLDYTIEGNVMTIYHTYVPEELRGQGIAEKLASAAFEYAIEKNLKVRPDCPYIKHFLQVHKDMVKYSVP